MGRSLYFTKENVNTPPSKTPKDVLEKICSLNTGDIVSVSFNNINDCLCYPQRTPSTYGYDSFYITDGVYQVKEINWDSQAVPDAIRAIELYPKESVENTWFVNDSGDVSDINNNLLHVKCILLNETPFNKDIITQLSEDEEYLIEFLYENEKEYTLSIPNTGYYYVTKIGGSFKISKKYFTTWIVTTDGYVRETEGLGILNYVFNICNQHDEH